MGYIEQSGRNMSRLAEVIGVNRRTLTRWIQNENQAGGESIVRFIHLLSLLDIAYDEAERLFAQHTTSTQTLTEVCREQQLAFCAEWLPFDRIVHLPPRLNHFTGRTAQLDELDAHFRQPNPLPLALVGIPGIGKTSLAAQYLHQAQHGYRDGVIFLSLQAMNTYEALYLLANLLKLPLAAPHGLLPVISEQVRDELRQRHLLLALDNCEDSTQLQYLAPHDGDCAVLATTREHLAYFDDHGRYLRLEPFSQTEAMGYMRRQLQAYGRAKHTISSSLDRTVRRLDGLPLALSISASLLASGVSEETLLNKMRALSAETLSVGDRSVYGAFELSYRRLSKQAQAMFDSLGLLRGATFGWEAIHAICDGVVKDPTAPFEELINANLIRVEPIGSLDITRYSIHRLLHDYAVTRLQTNAQAAQWRRRMKTYFIDWIDTHKQHFAQIALDSANILHALEAAKADGDMASFVRGVNAMYYYWYATLNFNLLSDYLDMAETLARKNGLWEHLIRTLVHLSLVVRDYGPGQLGALRSVDDYLNEASQVLAQHPNPMGAFLLHEAIMNHAKARRGEHLQKGEAAYEVARQLARDVLRIVNLQLNTLVNGAALASLHGHHQLAIDRLEEAENLLPEITDIAERERCELTLINQWLPVIGRIQEPETHQQVFEHLCENYERLQAIVDRTHNKDALNDMQINWSAYLLEHHQAYAEALAIAHAGIQLAQKMGHLENQAYFYVIIAQIMVAKHTNSDDPSSYSAMPAGQCEDIREKLKQAIRISQARQLAHVEQAAREVKQQLHLLCEAHRT